MEIDTDNHTPWWEKVIFLLIIVAIVALFVYGLTAGFEKEQRRRASAAHAMCDYYGDDINAWARLHEKEEPCQ